MDAPEPSPLPASPASRIAELALRLDRLEERLSRLEERQRAAAPLGGAGDGAPASEHPAAGAADAGAEAAADAAAAEATADAAAAAARGSSPEGLPLIGQTLLVLGGAFLLRALTEAGTLPELQGTVLGLGYAFLWLALCDRAAARGRGATAAFRGLAAGLIAFPLLWEATVEFHFLGPSFSAIALGLTTALGLLVAWRRRLRGLAWVIAGLAVPTAASLAFTTHAFVPYLGCLLLLGLGTIWLGYLRKWRLLAPAVALAVDFVFALVIALFLSEPKPEVVRSLAATSLIALQLVLILVYFGSIAVRTLIRGRNATVLEMGQSAAVLLIGLGGAIAVEHGAASTGGHRFGLIALLMAAGCYGVSFASIDRRLGRGRNFLFYTTLGLLLAVVGLAVVVDGRLLAVALAVAAVLAAGLGAARRRATLALHGAIYVAAAALAAGIPGAATRAFIAAPPIVPATLLLSPPVLLTLLAAAWSSWLRIEPHESTWLPALRVTQLVTLAVLALGVGGLSVTAGARILRASAGATVPPPGALAALRTGVLALLATALAWAGGKERFPAARWLVYPLLVIGGIKLVLEDLQRGRAATLVASMALYGLALIVAPRLLRGDRTSAGGGPASRRAHQSPRS